VSPCSARKTMRDGNNTMKRCNAGTHSETQGLPLLCKPQDQRRKRSYRIHPNNKALQKAL